MYTHIVLIICVYIYIYIYIHMCIMYIHIRFKGIMSIMFFCQLSSHRIWMRAFRTSACCQIRRLSARVRV